ncbi:DUF983 domain-containing protein [Pararhodonellum marinum]|uniref:DUF983 domain-containing protein n=1 Tax=Pararhodonellum marinum TaxID=2755358 RepID=UPI0018904425|nr:DUF983 domain-containing protein [Pararhodonellum marinum]
MERTGLAKAIIQAKCPKCRKGDLFSVPVYSYSKLTQIQSKCPVCQKELVPEPDFYYGAMFISYALSVALFINVMIVLNFFFNDPDLMVYLITVIIANLLLLPLMLRYSKVFYLYAVGRIKYEPQEE